MLYWVSMEGRKMIIKNVKVYQEDQTFKEGEICIRDGVFAGNAEAQAEEEILDGASCGPEKTFQAKAVCNFHLLIRSMMEQKQDVDIDRKSVV